MSTLANAFARNREIFTMKTGCWVGIALMTTVFLGCAACDQNRKKSVVPGSTPAPQAPVEHCFEDCMRANQMRATAIENIEADCKQSCAVP